MQPRSNRFLLRWFALIIGLFVLVAGGFGAIATQVGQTPALGASSLQPAYPYPPPLPRPQYIPAIVNLPRPTPTPEPFVPPIAVGQRNGWDGEGLSNWNGERTEIGTHLRRLFDQMVAADVIRSDNLYWYDPNPEDWEQEKWYEHYRLSTGRFVSSSVYSGPQWKFHHPWFLPYDVKFMAGQDVSISGQRFSVTGPHTGATEFGVPVLYWRLLNRDRVLYWEDGPWRQYVLPGELELHYHAGETGLLLYEDVMRRLYYLSSATSSTVRYVDWLTLSNAFPESARTADPSLSPPTPAPRPAVAPGPVLSEEQLDALPEIPANALLKHP